MPYTSRAANGASNLNAAQHDANLLLLARGLGFDPVSLNAASDLAARTLTAAKDACRPIFVNSASPITLVIGADGATAMTAGMVFGPIYNLGAGVVSFDTTGIPTPIKVTDIPATVEQGGAALLVKTPTANTYLRAA